MLRNYRVFIIIFIAMLVPATAGAVEIIISGKIVDRTGNPVPGVRFTVPGTVSLPHPGSIQRSRLFPGVPAECLQSSSSVLKTNAQGDYLLRANFDTARTVLGTIPQKACADYRGLINSANMKLVPHPDDIRKYDLVRAHGPLPQHVRNRNAREQVRPAGNPAPRGGFVPGR